MAKGQDNGATILLGFKDCKVEEVRGGEEKVVVKTTKVRGELNALIVAQASSMGTACASQGKYSIPGAMAEGFILNSTAAAGSAVIASTPLLKTRNWCGLVPGLPDRLMKKMEGGSIFFFWVESYFWVAKQVFWGAGAKLP